MLVAALEIEVSRKFASLFAVQDVCPAYAAVEPYIEDVVLLADVVSSAFRALEALGKELGSRFFLPYLDPVDGNFVGDFVGDLCVNDLFAAVVAGKGDDRNAPVPLPRDAPVRSLFEHRRDPLPAPLRHKFDLRDLVKALLTEPCVVHRDEPLFGRPEDHRFVASPAVRIAVVDELARLVEKVSRVVEMLDDDRVCLEDMHPADDRYLGVDDPAGVDRSIGLEPVFQAGQIVVGTVSRSRVDAAGTCISCDVIGVNDHRIAVHKGVSRLHPLEAFCVKFAEIDRIFGFYGLDETVAEIGRDDKDFAVVFYCRVLEFRMKRDRQICRKSPRSRRPDHEVDLLALKLGKLVDKRELYVDRRRIVHVVLDLSLGQSRFAACAPVNRLFRLEKRAGLDDLCELMCYRPLVFRVKRDVRIVPVCKNTEPFELLALCVYRCHRELFALLEEVALRHLLALGAELFSRLQLDRETVAVPAGSELGEVSRHILELDDEILQRLVEDVAVVKAAVCIGRPVVKHERGFISILLNDFKVNAYFIPFFEKLDLLDRQIGLHREIGLRKIECFAVIHLHLHKKKRGMLVLKCLKSSRRAASIYPN